MSSSDAEMNGRPQIRCKLSTLQFKLKQRLILFHSSVFQDVLNALSTWLPSAYAAPELFSICVNVCVQCTLIHLKWSSVRFAFRSPATHMQLYITLWHSLCGPSVQLPSMAHNQSVNKTELGLWITIFSKSQAY